MVRKRIWSLLFLAIVLSFCPLASSARDHGIDIILFSPATDGGKYLTLQQSKTLKQFSFNVGQLTDYARHPLEIQNVQSGTRVGGKVDDLVVTQIFGAFGVTDWLSFGANFPIGMWETQYIGAVKTGYHFKPGDLRVDAKFRILDIDRYHLGLSLVPFMYFPTGKVQYFLGNGMWSPGASIVFDADIMNRVFLTLNTTYRNYSDYRWQTTNPNARLDDTFGVGGGANIRITDDWAALGELWTDTVIKDFFKSKYQSPTEFLAGVKYTPQKFARGLGVTLAGGRGVISGPGTSQYRVLLGINYRYEKTPPPAKPVEVEATVEEKIVITQKIHFEFNRSVIQEVSHPILNDVAKILRDNTEIKVIRVEGHTDWIGSDAYNRRLSQSRAEAVRAYLIKQGIEAGRLEALGFGESKPIADNNSALGRAKNRRVEFTVLK